jgi:hypothetical protein
VGFYVKKARKMENDDKYGKLKCFGMVWWNAVQQKRHQISKMATTIVKSLDGSIYKGQLDRFGKRTGFGTYRTPIMLYGVYDPANSSRLMNWMEYRGEWQDDEASGRGTMWRYRGDGTNVVVYEGDWKNGEPAFEPGVSAC